MVVVLIGYMGSGKSAVGKELARTLGIPFTDLDEKIIEEVGMPIPQLFEEKGEIFFRKKEGAVLQQLLQQKESAVLATGGGTPCYGNIMEILQKSDNTITVYLRGGVGTLTQRLFRHRTNRPLIAHLNTPELLEDFIRKHLFERSFYYNQASIVVDIDTKPVPEIVQEIYARLF
ncbi:MAG: shikimate kinase [Flavobacteriaceae bacterium]|nr:shikimate kinase [Flavobacteriaceae bacterium]|tara:strand:- start:446 stop:967 length:522 start_codon:yes stop_codon:yes gene_type:complete